MKPSARTRPIRALVICASTIALAASCAPRNSAEARQAAPVTVSAPVVAGRILARFPHDPAAFTQGLIIRDGRMFESVGGYQGSDVREVELATGRVIRRTPIPAGEFGEGLATFGAELFSLTWQNGFGHRWRIADLSPTGRFDYYGEGWGLTSDRRTLILSDGTAELRFLDPGSFRLLRRVTVTDGATPVTQLNELEWVDGEVLANVWHTARIARIDPATGKVKGWIDLSAVVDATPRRDSEAVLNGIAWDARAKRLYVTGKNWPTLYRIAWPVD